MGRGSLNQGRLSPRSMLVGAAMTLVLMVVVLCTVGFRPLSFFVAPGEVQFHAPQPLLRDDNELRVEEEKEETEKGRREEETEEGRKEEKVGSTGWRKVVCKTPPASLPSLPVKLAAFNPSASDKNFFFLETTCASSINTKMACAVESAARQHLDHQIHLALTSTHVGGADLIMQALSSLHNVRISALDVDAMDATTELGRWLREKMWKAGAWPAINLSDTLRLLLVCSLGGTYMDLDMWLVKPLPQTQAWIGREQYNKLTNAVFRFPKDHWYCKAVIREYIDNFRPMVWGYNGPTCLTNTITKSCKIVLTPQTYNCRDLYLLEPSALYEKQWTQWQEYFKPNGSRQWQWPDNMMGIHLSNKLSHDKALNPGDGSIVDVVAQKSCPSVYKIARDALKEGDHPRETV